MPSEINFAVLGFVLIVIGIIVIFVSAFSQKSEGGVKIGFGGFIGPVPFGWSNDPDLMKIIIVASVVIAVIFLILTLRVFL